MVLGPIFLSIGLIGEIISCSLKAGSRTEYCVDEVLEGIQDAKTSNAKEDRNVVARR